MDRRRYRDCGYDRDLLLSLVQRRLGIPASGMALRLDQIPEALLLLAMTGEFVLTWLAIGGTVASFIALELAISLPFYLDRHS
jgi:hypothetical protein